MDKAKITLKQQTVKHNDADEAGWSKGWWWTLKDGHGTFESGAAAKAEARETAVEVAHSHGYSDDRIKVAR
jgi:ribosome-associated protein YbcJ (S4-like RNA binding protein)